MCKLVYRLPGELNELIATERVLLSEVVLPADIPHNIRVFRSIQGLEVCHQIFVTQPPDSHHTGADICNLRIGNGR